MNAAFESAKSTLVMLQNMDKATPGNPHLLRLIADAETSVSQFAPPAAPEPTPLERLNAWADGVNERLAKLEQMAMPVIGQAEQAGMAIMGALGKSMRPDQAEWVQSRLDQSAEFFMSPDCHAAVELFIGEWRNFEERRKPK